MTPRTTRVAPSASGAGVRKPDPRTPKLLWRLAFGVALALQLIVVYAPSGPGGPEITGLDKVVHVFIFFAPALAALMMGIRARWALGILALHAPVSELIQHFALPQRDGDVFDVMADLMGVVLGGLAHMVWKRRHP
jgi:VanZ family protein